jgi:hypothetical protein
MSDDQQKTLGEIAASIRATLGVTDDDPEREYRRIIRNAQEDASVCAKCSRQIAASDPVWRDRLSLGRSLFCVHHRETIAPVCSSCVSKYDGLSPRFSPGPCDGCGRVVHNLYSGPDRSLWFCSEVCQAKARAAQGRERRREARDSQTCEGCAKTFNPTRMDARFCSVACKQRAYRQRVTDNAVTAQYQHKKRNAKGVTDNECGARFAHKKRNAKMEGGRHG